MSTFNRVVMLIAALLLICVPVFLLLVGLGVLSANQINAATGYRNALGALEGFSASSFSDIGSRILLAVVGILVALVALLLLLRELTFGRSVTRKALIDETPGRETAITAQAVRRLAEGAATEAGAASPKCYLTSKNRRYEVSCDIQIPGTQDFAELASHTRHNIRRILEEQRVPIKDVEITVQGTASQE
jgi:hypothetical protein